MMRAVAKKNNSAKSLSIVSRENPEPESNEVIVQVENVGICGSDYGIYVGKDTYDWVDFPRVLGHEYSGSIISVGEQVENHNVGDRVVERPLRPCQQCETCYRGDKHLCENIKTTGFDHDGAFAPYIRVPESSIHKLWGDITYQEAALLEPTSVAVRAIQQNSRISACDDVLIEGPGPIGILSAQVAEAQGANVTITGVNKDSSYRLPLASDLGYATYNVSDIALEKVVKSETVSEGYDVIVDATGHPSGLENSITAVKKGGQVVVVGIPGEINPDFSYFVRSEIDIQCSYTSLWPDFERALKLINSGMMNPGEIVEEYSIKEPKKAFEAFSTGDTVKPMFQPQMWQNK